MVIKEMQMNGKIRSEWKEKCINLLYGCSRNKYIELQENSTIAIKFFI